MRILGFKIVQKCNILTGQHCAWYIRRRPTPAWVFRSSEQKPRTLRVLHARAHLLVEHSIASCNCLEHKESGLAVRTLESQVEAAQTVARKRVGSTLQANSFGAETVHHPLDDLQCVDLLWR